MAALTDSGQISFGDIIGNRGASESDVAIKQESEFFAVGSAVGDVDGNGTPNETDDRTALDAAPYSISEFYGANYPNTYFDTCLAKVSTTSVMDNGFIDGETGRIYFTVNSDPPGTTTYTAGLKYASNNNVVVSDTYGSTDPGASTIYVEITVPDVGAASDLYYPFVTTGTYSNAVGANINHYDVLTGGATVLTTDGSTGYTSATVSAAGEAITAVVVSGTTSGGSQSSITLGSITSITAGDGGTMAGTYGSGEDAYTATISNTPGVIRFAVQHNGPPSTARNNISSTADFTVSYVRAIDGVASTDYTVNSGVSFTVTAISEGITSTTTMKMGISTSNSNTSYNSSADKSISTSQFVRSEQTNAFSVGLTSGTSLATYYPKAHYTSGATNVTAGSAIYIAPAFSYSTTGNQTINVNQTQAMAASSVVGNSANVAIASSPSLQTGNNSVTFSPSTANGVYTISYTGTANYSQTSNTTDLLTVRPTVSLARSAAEVFGFGSYSSNHTPTGVSTTNVTITTSVTGTASTYNWTLPSGTTVSGGGSGDPTVTMNFSGTAGTKTFSLTVTGTAIGGSSTTSTSDSIDVAYTIYTQQNIWSVTPNSGDYRRGATTINVAWYSVNVALVDIHLVADGSGTSTTAQTTNNDSLDTANANENQTYSATIVDVGVSNVGTYHVRVRDASDNVPTSTAVSTISVLDTAPTTPGAFQDTAGGYNGSLTMDWAASSYRYQYQIEKSSGDGDSSYSQLGSNQTGTSVGLSELSGTATYGPFYYRVRALNFAQGGTSTEYSSYNSARRFIIYPTLDAGNNIPQPASSTIYSTNLNSSTTSTVMNVTSDSDNVTGYSWATSLTSGASISSTTAQNPTITAGGGVGTISATLTVSGNASQTYEHSTDNITVNYWPKIYNVTTNQEAGTTILINTTDLIVKNIYWQGFTSAGFTVGVYSGTGGSGYERSEGPFTINDVGGTYAYAANVNNTGGAQTKESEWSHNSLCNMGVISQVGTVYVRILDAGGSIAYDEAITIADYENVQLTGYQFGGATSGFDDAEDAVQVTIPGGTSTYNVTVYYVGTPGSGTVVILDTQSPTDYFAGGNKWWDFSGLGITGYVGLIDNSGNLTAANYYSDGNAQPKAPTGIGFGSITSGAITVSWSNVSAIEDNYYIYYKTGTANDADYNDTHFSTLAANTTSDVVDGLAAGTSYSFVVYAKNGSSWSSALRGTSATAVGTEWTTVPDDFEVTVTSGTATSADKAYVLAGASGNSTFEFAYQSGGSIFQLNFAVGTSSSPTNWTGGGGTITLGAATNYYMRVKHQYRGTFAGNTAVWRMIATNNGEVDNCDVTLNVGAGGS